MACRICSCIFDGIRFIKLPNVYNWESLVNVIDSRIVMDVTFFQDICVDCYQKLDKFINFRHLHISNVKYVPKYTPYCTICKIIVVNGTTLTGKEWFAQRQCIRTLLPYVIFKDGDNLYVCQHCLAVLTEFNQFWEMFLSNFKPSSRKNRQRYEVDNSVRISPSVFDIKTEQFDIKTREDMAVVEAADKENEERRKNEEMLSLKFTFKTVCESIREEIDCEDKMLNINDESNKIDIKSEMDFFYGEESRCEKDKNYYIENNLISNSKIECNDTIEKPCMEKLYECNIGKVDPLYETKVVTTIPTNIVKSNNESCTNEYKHAEESIEDETEDRKTVKQNYINKDSVCDDLDVEEHDPYEKVHKNYRVRSKKLAAIYKIPYLCHYCPNKFTKSTALLKHHKEKHKFQPVKHTCPLCQFTTTRRKYLTRHYYFNHKEDFVLHSCPLCEFQTKRTGHLRAHVNKHYGSVMHKCNQCDFETKWPFSLKCHIIAKHDTTSKFLNCTLCSYSTKFTNELNKHIKYKHSKDNKFLKCPKCNYRSHFQAWFNKHVKYQHPDVERTYKCQLCKFQSRLYSSLSKHEKTVHSGDMTVFYKCELCDHRTKYKGNLKIHHILKHTEDAQMVQCAQCSFQTRLKGDLSKHLRYRHGNLPRLSCPHCTHTTVRRSHLTEHIRRQHEGNHRIYQCEECDHKTKYVGNLRQHQQVRHGKSQQYSCELCKHSTKYRHNLKGHYRVCHGMPDVVLDKNGKISNDAN